MFAPECKVKNIINRNQKPDLKKAEKNHNNTKTQKKIASLLLHKYKISSERKLQLWKQTRLSFSCDGAETITDKAYPVKVVKTKSENKDHEEKEKKITSQPVIIYYENNRSES